MQFFVGVFDGLSLPVAQWLEEDRVAVVVVDDEDVVVPQAGLPWVLSCEVNVGLSFRVAVETLNRCKDVVSSCGMLAGKVVSVDAVDSGCELLVGTSRGLQAGLALVEVAFDSRSGSRRMFLQPFEREPWQWQKPTVECALQRGDCW